MKQDTRATLTMLMAALGSVGQVAHFVDNSVEVVTLIPSVPSGSDNTNQLPHQPTLLPNLAQATSEARALMENVIDLFAWVNEPSESPPSGTTPVGGGDPAPLGQAILRDAIAWSVERRIDAALHVLSANARVFLAGDGEGGDMSIARDARPELPDQFPSIGLDDVIEYATSDLNAVVSRFDYALSQAEPDESLTEVFVDLVGGDPIRLFGDLTLDELGCSDAETRVAAALALVAPPALRPANPRGAVGPDTQPLTIVNPD